MRPDDVARLTTLEKENARLKRLLAEKELDNDMAPCSPRENGDPESKASGRCAPRGRSRDAPRGVGGESLSRELVSHVQDRDGPAIGGFVELKVKRPDVLGMSSSNHNGF